MSEDKGTEQVAVTTYVPEYQRDEWNAHAEELDMSTSEFVRSMVQAGRRGFEKHRSSTTNPRGNMLETVLQDALESEGMTFDELTDQVNDELESAIMELREAGHIEQDIHGALRWQEA